MPAVSGSRGIFKIYGIKGRLKTAAAVGAQWRLKIAISKGNGGEEGGRERAEGARGGEKTANECGCGGGEGRDGRWGEEG